MTELDTKSRRRKAAEYFETHSIDEDEADTEEVTLEVRKPLSIILSLRLDEADMSKLRQLAKTQGIGLTTMARMLIHQGLEDPKKQMVLQALRSEGVRESIAAIIEDAIERRAEISG